MTVEAVNQSKKDLETWDYFILDEFMYAGESPSRKGKIKDGYIERYLRSDLYLCCTIKWRDYNSVIISKTAVGAVNARPVIETNHRLGETGNDFPVFINAVDLVKPPKTFNWRPIRSIVRLKTFNDRMDFDGYINYFPLSPASRIIEVNLTVKNGELCTSSRIVSTQQRQLPSQMVEGRPKVVSNLTDNQPPFLGGFPVYLKRDNLERLFRIVIWDDLAWFGLRFPEQTDFLVEGLELFFCPDDFEFGTIERVHILYSGYCLLLPAVMMIISLWKPISILLLNHVWTIEK